MKWPIEGHGFTAVDDPSYDLVSVKKDEGFVATATIALQPELKHSGGKRLPAADAGHPAAAADAAHEPDHLSEPDPRDPRELYCQGACRRREEHPRPHGTGRFGMAAAIGLRHPASASCLGRHLRLAGRCPNNSSLFPPLAAVVVVARHIQRKPVPRPAPMPAKKVTSTVNSKYILSILL